MRNQPILSEDVMKQRLPHLMKPNKKKAKEGAGADPFAPEYGPDSWFAKHQVGGWWELVGVCWRRCADGGGGGALLVMVMVMCRWWGAGPASAAYLVV